MSDSISIDSASSYEDEATEDTAYRIPEPQPPIEEVFDPRIDTCLTHQEVLVVPHHAEEPVPRKVDLVKSDNPTQAYAIVQSKRRKDLSHHAPGWGFVCFAIVLPRDAQGIFHEPASKEALQYVAIKCLQKSVVHDYLQKGGHENPYKEIDRMQQLGDNIHVLGCVEVLQDETTLFIVMPYCEAESLVEAIPWNRGLADDQAKRLFQQVVENVLYLHDHGICHRDVSPDNCMVYQGRVVLTDLAMSFRIPESGYVSNWGNFGKRAYLSPEVFMNWPFEAKSCDTWSAAVILFNLLTGEFLYDMPLPSDMMFRYFIMAGGLSRTANNERIVEVLMSLENAERTKLYNLTTKCMSLHDDVREILENVLQMQPQQRWSLTDVGSSTWITQNP